MFFDKHWPMIPTLFDGEGGSAGAAGAAGGEGGAEAAGGTQGSPDHTRRGKAGGAYDNVIFGKVHAAAEETEQKGTAADAGQQGETVEPQKTDEERRKAWKEAISGEYKDLYTEDTQRIINRRFAEVKGLQEQLSAAQPVLDMLMARYGVKDGDLQGLMRAVESDDKYWEAAADEAGMSTEQYKQMQRLQRENEQMRRFRANAINQQRAQAQLAKWNGEAAELKSVYPSFELQAEVQNSAFMAMLKAGVPMRNAYESIHHQELVAAAQAAAASQMEKGVVQNIRARGQRPAENGASSQSGFTVKDDPAKFTKADRAEIVRRAMRGEKIEL